LMKDKYGNGALRQDTTENSNIQRRSEPISVYYDRQMPELTPLPIRPYLQSGEPHSAVTVSDATTTAAQVPGPAYHQPNHVRNMQDSQHPQALVSRNSSQSWYEHRNAWEGPH
jgi:hypothetical protein